MLLRRVVIATALLISSATYAFIPCNGDSNSAVVCINFSKPSSPIFTDTIVNGLTKYQAIEEHNTTGSSDIFLDNNNVIQALSMKLLKTHANEIIFYTCKEKSCLHKSYRGHFMFDLSKDNKGNYTALPTGTYNVKLP